MSNALRERGEKRTREEANRILIPYDTVRDYLEGNPLLVGADVKPETVHKLLLRVHEWMSRPSLPRPPPSMLPRQACPSEECAGSYVEVDARNGCTLCASCGVVLVQNVNVEPEFQTGVSSSDVSKGNRVKGLSSKASEQARSAGQDRGPSYMNDLQHWNQFTLFSEDSLEEVNAWMRGWTSDPSRAQNDRLLLVVTFLVYRKVRHGMLDEEEVRDRLRKQLPLPVLRGKAPLPSFPCMRCGEKVHSRKEARVHCKWGQRRR